jgi:NADH-quinone oxidoreductase subunit J
MMMALAFYVAGAVAVIATLLMLTRVNIVHGLLYLIVSLLAVAVVFSTLGAPFAAALEVIVYAGAIMVLFIFVVMMLNLGDRAAETERRWLTPGIWTGPAVLAAVLVLEMVFLLRSDAALMDPGSLDPNAVAVVLFGPYLICVELVSMLLLAGLVGAYHLGFHKTERRRA